MLLGKVQKYLAGKVIRIPVVTHRDLRGSLCPIQFDFDGFQPVRAFVVSAPDGQTRGGHAHARCRQVLLLVSGRIDIEATDGIASAKISLDAENRALLIEPNVWSEQIFHGACASMIVFCDIPFEKEEYIHSVLELSRTN